MRGHAALLVALLLIAGCSRREHLNPFDPDNPTTGGRPTGFAALAGNAQVAVRWQAASERGVLGFQIFRRVEGETVFSPLTDLLPPSQSGYKDYGLANGVEHHYRLYYVFPQGVSGTPAEDSAIPGPLVPWVTDLSAASLLRLTADGRHVASAESGFRGPTQLAVDPASGVVWISDTFDGSVVIYNPQNLTRTAVRGFGSPTSIAVDRTSHEAWICDEDRNSLYHLTSGGDAASPALIAPLSLPISVAVDPGDGSVWVCENEGQPDRSVRHFRSDGTPIASAPVERPSRVAVDDTRGEAWVTSFQRQQVHRISPAGAILNTISRFSGPIGIAVDASRDRVWVADTRADAVIALNLGGDEVLRVSGLSEVREVAVDAATGDAWATLPGSGEIVSISGDGSIRVRLGGLSQPYAIALDPGTHETPLPRLIPAGLRRDPAPHRDPPRPGDAPPPGARAPVCPRQKL